MKRWHLTPILATLAVASALVVPRLTGTQERDPAMAEDPDMDSPEPEVELEVAQPPGHVHLDARLDRSALLAGTSASRYLTLTLTADEDVGISERRPVDVVVIMDTSGSMAAAGKLTYARQAAAESLQLLSGVDRFGLVTFSRYASVIHPSQPLSDSRGQAAASIHTVVAQGDTNIYDALRVGADQLGRDGVPGGRLLLLSDGIATSGQTDPGSIARYAEALAEQGVVVSAIGLGLEHDGHLLSRLALAGGGDYDFVDAPSQLASVLSDDMSQHVAAVARDLSIDLDLPDGVELVDVHGWRVQRSGSTLSIPVGDLSAGESKRVVVQLRTRAPEAIGTTAIASVRARWHDLPDDAPREAVVETEATVTAAVAVVEQSVDETAQAVSAQAVASGLLAKAAHAFSQGDAGRAESLAGEGLAVLEAAPMSAAPIPEVAEAQKTRMRKRAVTYTTTSPSSDAGRHATLEDMADAYEWAH